MSVTAFGISTGDETFTIGTSGSAMRSTRKPGLRRTPIFRLVEVRVSNPDMPVTVTVNGDCLS